MPLSKHLLCMLKKGDIYLIMFLLWVMNVYVLLTGAIDCGQLL